MHRLLLIAVLSAIALLGGCASGDTGTSASSTTVTTASPEEGADGQQGGEPGEIDVTMTDAEGAEVGTVSLRANDAGVRVRAELRGLTPGFHGFHIHDVGLCEANAPDGPFTTAAGHFVGDGGTHGDHDGDLPSLYVTEAGTAALTVTVDTFTVEDLTAGDRAAVMVHAGPDNFANVPDRYTATGAPEPGPDQMTTSTGDAGGRAACGVIEPAQP
jgi:Cu-Zn family superoxide dismutase